MKWLSIDMDQQIAKLDKVKNRLRQFLNSKHQPKKKTIDNQIHLGDKLVTRLDRLLMETRKNREFKYYFEEIETFYDLKGTRSHIDYELERVADYYYLRNTVLAKYGDNYSTRYLARFIQFLR